MLHVNLSPRNILGAIFTVFAVVPFCVWLYDKIARADAGILGEWPMLMVTVVFTALSIIVSDRKQAMEFASGVAGSISDVLRARGGAGADEPEPEPEPEEVLPESD